MSHSGLAGTESVPKDIDDDDDVGQKAASHTNTNNKTKWIGFFIFFYYFISLIFALCLGVYFGILAGNK